MKRRTATTTTLALVLSATLVGGAAADSSTITISDPTVVYEEGDPVVEITELDGVGALYLDTPASADKAQVLVTTGDGATLADLESLSYRTYREAGSGQQVASLNITVEPWAGTFVYEPVYDRSEQDVESGVWQEWDAFSPDARWWRSGVAAAYVSWESVIAGFEDRTVTSILVNQGSGNLALQSYVDFVEVNGTTYDFAPAVLPPAEIIAPTPGQEIQVGTDLELRATDVSAAAGGVQWAVRFETCEPRTSNIAGNVDGMNDPFTWNGGDFAATLSTTGWELGTYCFVFNPSLGGRLVVEFAVVAAPPPPVTLDGKDDCKRGGWELSEDPVFGNQGDCVSHFARMR